MASTLEQQKHTLGVVFSFVNKLCDVRLNSAGTHHNPINTIYTDYDCFKLSYWFVDSDSSLLHFTAQFQRSHLGTNRSVQLYKTMYVKGIEDEILLLSAMIYISLL